MTKNSKICNFNVMLFWFISCDRFHNKKWTCLLQNKLTMLFHLLKLLYTNHFTFNTHSQYCMNAFLYLFQGLCLLLLNVCKTQYWLVLYKSNRSHSINRWEGTTMISIGHTIIDFVIHVKKRKFIDEQLVRVDWPYSIYSKVRSVLKVNK